MNRKQEYEKITQKLYDILKYTDISSNNPQVPKNGVDIDTVLWVLKCDWPWIEIEDLQYIVSHCTRLGIYMFGEVGGGLMLAKRNGYFRRPCYQWKKAVPPEWLYYPISCAKWSDISKQFKEGLPVGVYHIGNQYIWLYEDLKTASEFGEMRGPHVVLAIAARQMAMDYKDESFLHTENGYWITPYISFRYIHKANELKGKEVTF